MINSICKDPFRLFFPFGAAFAVIAALPWLGLPLFPFNVQVHKSLMMNGFILSFTCGFLMTAVPRFTKSNQAQPWEILVAAVSLTAILITAVAELWLLHFSFVGLALANLILFAAKRFIKRLSNPPYTFIFVGASLLFWLISALSIALSFQIEIPYWPAVSQALINKGVVLGLIYGVGGRLIPGILGWTAIVEEQKKSYEQPISFWKTIPPTVLLSVALFYGSFLLSPIMSSTWANFFRTLVALYFALAFWRLYRIPNNKSYLTWSLWIGAWCIVMGELLIFLRPELGTSVMHVGFIGGFALITFTIATRVIRAHSSIDIEFESNTRAIAVITSLLLVAMVTRATATAMPASYTSHLLYAALIWIAAIFLWAWRIGRLIRK